MPSATITSKGRITLPKEIREHLGVATGDRLSFQIGGAGEVVVGAQTYDVRTLRGMLKHRGRSVSLKAMDRAVRRGATGR
jgi:AbrB family looped-hinge helix DNA binding protein